RRTVVGDQIITSISPITDHRSPITDHRPPTTDHRSSWLKGVDMGNRPHVLIIGGGFGGLPAAQYPKHAPARITLIARTNHHLFQPLLYQVAMAGLSPAEIASPIRAILRRQKNLTVLLSEAASVDLTRRTVRFSECPILYDYLVLATGGRACYFGHTGWA